MSKSKSKSIGEPVASSRVYFSADIKVGFSVISIDILSVNALFWCARFEIVVYVSGELFMYFAPPETEFYDQISPKIFLDIISIRC